MLKTRPIPVTRSKPPAKRVLVAVREFTTLYGGEQVTIAKGERVVDDHELVARHPDAFAPAGSARADRKPRGTKTPYHPRDARARKAPRTDMLPRPSWALGPLPPLHCPADVELRDSTSPVNVKLSDGARDDIDAEIRATPRGYETGGLLIGRPDRDGTVHIFEAWGPGPTAEQTRNSLGLDYGVELSRARRLRDATDDACVLVGAWHTHPRGDDRPSPGDLGVFGELLERASSQVYPLEAFIGLIIINPDRSHGPPPTAWVVRHTSRTRDLICERGDLTTR